MSTYLRHIGGFKHTHLKSKSYEEIQRLFDIEIKRVHSIIPMDSEVVEGSEKKAEESSAKRAGAKLEQDVSKKQKIDDQDKEKMKQHMEIVLDEEELVFDVVPLATKPPVVMIQDIDREDLETLWKLVKAKHRNTRPKEGYERVL
ncbi:hypothetical protein Tco_1552459 [Tanacetum coccineum]